MSALNNTPPSPAPQPPQTGDGPPTMPQPGAPDFDQRMRVYEAWQRERSIAATTALATAQDRGAAAAEALLTTPMPTEPALLAAMNRLAAAIEGMPSPGDAPPAEQPAPQAPPEWLPELRAALQEALAAQTAVLAVLNRVQ